MSTTHDTCIRCTRPAPPIESDEIIEWEAADAEGNMICPGCLTAEEEQAIIEDVAEVEASLASCSRCQRPFTEQCDRDRWEILGDEYVCPECMTLEDRKRVIRDHKSATALISDQTDKAGGV